MTNKGEYIEYEEVENSINVDTRTNLRKLIDYTGYDSKFLGKCLIICTVIVIAKNVSINDGLEKNNKSSNTTKNTKTSYLFPVGNMEGEYPINAKEFNMTPDYIDILTRSNDLAKCLNKARIEANKNDITDVKQVSRIAAENAAEVILLAKGQKANNKNIIDLLNDTKIQAIYLAMLKGVEIYHQYKSSEGDVKRVKLNPHN
jgi:hypothetical protein